MGATQDTAEQAASPVPAGVQRHTALREMTRRAGYQLGGVMAQDASIGLRVERRQLATGALDDAVPLTGDPGRAGHQRRRP